MATYQAMADAVLKKEVLPRVIEALSEEDRRFARSVPVEITLESNPFQTGLVERDDGRTIRISAAFLAALDIASDATAFAIYTKRYQDLPRFATEYSQFVRQQWWEQKPGAPARMFSEYLDLPAKQAQAFRSSSEYRALRLAIMQQSLAWISAHYMGHLVIDRRDPVRKGENLREREGTIDAFATDLAYSAGYSAMPPLPNMVLFVTIDHPDRDHGPADWMCRSLEVTRRGLATMERERRASAQRDSTQRADTFKPEKAELQRLRKLYRCPTR